MNKAVKEQIIVMTEKRISNPFSENHQIVLALARTVYDIESRDALLRLMVMKSLSIREMWKSREERVEFYREYLQEVANNGIDYEQKLKNYHDNKN